MVMTQYRPNWGVVLTPMDLDKRSLLSQSKREVEKSAEMKLPGKKNMVTTARVFIEAESR